MNVKDQAQAAAGEIQKAFNLQSWGAYKREYIRAIAAIIEKHFAYVADLEAASTRFSMVKARTTIDETAAEIVKQIDEAFIENGRPPMTEADKAEGIREIGIVIKDRFALLLGYVDWLEAAMERVKALRGELCEDMDREIDCEWVIRCLDEAIAGSGEGDVIHCGDKCAEKINEAIREFDDGEYEPMPPVEQYTVEVDIASVEDGKPTICDDDLGEDKDEIFPNED